jgi:ADP-ribose pyrophosphatase YjhB (NUDIX family)
MEQMSDMEPPMNRWLLRAREIQALTQAGLVSTQDDYDRERYRQLDALAAQVLAQHGSLDPSDSGARLAPRVSLATPKLGVRGAIFRDDRMLLVRERADHHRWTLPGGWVDVNETPASAVAREVREEAGLHVRAYKLAAVWDRARHPHGATETFHVWRLFFLCEITGGELRCGPETSEAGFFAEHELPQDLSTRRVLLPQLRRMFTHLRQPALPTDLD